MKYRSKTPLAILLATYNSEKYLAEQLESLYSQTNMDWTLFVHDDGSSDNTIQIIEDYMTRYDNIVIVDGKSKKRGAKYNFMYLLNCVESEYYMFCDHDDVWFPAKIEISMDQMRMHTHKNTCMPILLHTNLMVVNEFGEIINKSMWRYAKIKPALLKKWNFFMVCNFVTGNTMCFNYACRQLSLDMPDNALMHDWWIAMQMAKNGLIISLDTPLVRYRLHKNNACGIPKCDTDYVKKKLSNVSKLFDRYNSLEPLLKQVGYGSKTKFLFYKLIYTLLRAF